VVGRRALLVAADVEVEVEVDVDVDVAGDGDSEALGVKPNHRRPSASER
jgi:hypothetical protein